MRCEQIDELISDYSVGNLPRRVEERVREHVSTCRACAVEMERLELVMSAVEEEMTPVEPPVGLWNGVYNRISSPKRESVRDRVGRVLLRPRKVLSFGIGLATLAIVAFLGVSEHRQQVVATVSDPAAIEYVQSHLSVAAGDVFADRVSLGFAVSLSAEETRDQL
ncbi:MAG: zf-HC2 domain-containing protein [Armatimonadetes bacterium]|nr:zf-HC2 domain-containing protein [Armatimonadota bacterium]